MDALISIDEALRRIFAHTQYEKVEASDLIRTLGKVVAKDIYALHDMPAFDRAMLDGYAVRYEDIAGATRETPALLTVREHVPAGTMPTGILQSGEAFRTMTGAPIATGADTLVQQEFTETEDGQGTQLVKILKSVSRGDAIQNKGHEVVKGQVLLHKGTVIGVAEISLLASQGLHHVDIVTPPRVGIISTGSEVIELGQPLAPGQLYNSNTPLLMALVREAGGQPEMGLAVQDDREVMRQAFLQALDQNDVLITTGGVSVGDYDITPSVLEELGVKRLFWGVYMRPGTPVYVGTYFGKLVFALSGNPPAAFVNARVLVIPAIHHLLGIVQSNLSYIHARLTNVPQKKKVKHTRFLTGHIFERNGEWWIDVGGDQSAGSMVRFTKANALAKVTPEDELLEGTLVQVEILGAFY